MKRIAQEDDTVTAQNRGETERGSRSSPAPAAIVRSRPSAQPPPRAGVGSWPQPASSMARGDAHECRCEPAQPTGEGNRQEIDQKREEQPQWSLSPPPVGENLDPQTTVDEPLIAARCHHPPPWTCSAASSSARHRDRAVRLRPLAAHPPRHHRPPRPYCPVRRRALAAQEEWRPGRAESALSEGEGGDAADWERTRGRRRGDWRGEEAWGLGEERG